MLCRYCVKSVEKTRRDRERDQADKEGKRERERERRREKHANGVRDGVKTNLLSARTFAFRSELRSPDMDDMSVSFS